MSPIFILGKKYYEKYFPGNEVPTENIFSEIFLAGEFSERNRKIQCKIGFVFLIITGEKMFLV